MFIVAEFIEIDEKGFWFQAKKSDADLKEVTHKVFFDVEIDGKPAGKFFLKHNRNLVLVEIEILF